MGKLDQLRALRERQIERRQIQPIAAPAAAIAAKTKRDRKDYMREYMRRKRAKA